MPSRRMEDLDAMEGEDAKDKMKILNEEQEIREDRRIPCVRPGLKKVMQEDGWKTEEERMRKHVLDVVVPVYKSMLQAKDVRVHLRCRKASVQVNFIPESRQRCAKNAKGWQCGEIAPSGFSYCIKHRIHGLMHRFPSQYREYLPTELANLFPTMNGLKRKATSMDGHHARAIKTCADMKPCTAISSPPVIATVPYKTNKQKRSNALKTPEEVAMHEKVLWVKQTGYPFWPAQKIDRKRVKTVLPPSIDESELDAVQFFGTRDYGLLRPKFSVLAWSEGLQKGLDSAKLKSLCLAIQEAKDFLMPGESRMPPGWWSVEPQVEIPEPVQEEQCSEMPLLAWPPGKMRCVEPSNFSLPGYVLDSRRPQFSHIRKSLWTHAIPPRRLPREEVEICNCRPSSDGGPSCGDDCMNRRMYVNCDPKTCPCGDSCSNVQFHRRKMPRLVPVLTEHCGWGVVSKDQIPKGSFVIEYVGEIIDESECASRLWEAKARGERNFYLMEIGPSMIIDARHKSNIARLINSSCRPNCETQKWRDAATGEIRVGIFALRDIAPEEHLTYDYQFEHYGETNATSFLCRCGAPDCRGRLDKVGRGKFQQGRTVFVRSKDGIFIEGKVVKYMEETESFLISFKEGKREVMRLRPKEHFWYDEDSYHSFIRDCEHKDVGKKLKITRGKTSLRGTVLSYLPEVDAHEIKDPSGQRWYIDLSSSPFSWIDS